MRDVERRIQQAQARLRDLKAIERKQIRRDETRRKIIFGAATLQLLKDLRSEDVRGEKAERFMRLLNERITRPIDREFLGLSETDNALSRDN